MRSNPLQVLKFHTVGQQVAHISKRLLNYFSGYAIIESSIATAPSCLLRSFVCVYQLIDQESKRLMNAEQLLITAKIVLEDLKSAKLVQSLNALTQSLQQLAGNQNDQNAQRGVSTNRDELFQALTKLKSDNWPTGLQQMLAEIGGEFLLNGYIRSIVEEALMANQLSPAAALEKVKPLSQELSEFIARLNALVEALSALDIDDIKLQPKEVEITLVIPRSSINNNFGTLGYELSQLDQIFKLISVAAIGTREEFELYQISTSEPKFYLRPNIKTAAVIGALFIGILESLNQVADLKIKYDQIMSAGISEEALGEVKREIGSKLETELDRLREDLIEKYCPRKPSADRNEDRNRLDIAIKQLAPRFEVGYRVDLRYGELPSAETDEGVEDLSELAILTDIREISHHAKRLEASSSPMLPPPASLTNE